MGGQVIGLTRDDGHTGTIQPVYRNATSYNGMSTATELGMAPANSAGSNGALTGVLILSTTWIMTYWQLGDLV